MVEIAAYGSLVMSGVSVLSVIYFGAVKIAKLEVKVDTLWDFQMRRAFSEAVSTGVATMNSPLQITEKAKHKLDPMKVELQQFWEENKTLPGIDIIMKLESKFGDQILKELCIPLGLSHGSCLLIALAVAKGVDTINLDEIKSGLVYH